ncbi:MAG: S41 family peptidase [Planctomycetes bacterium]|nr:S41 family peptidase [Planctomycetota bacterium]
MESNRDRSLPLARRSCPLSRALAIALTLLCCALAGAQEAPAAADIASDVAQVVERYGAGDLATCWAGARALETLGDGAVAEIQKLLDASPARTRLMAIKALVALGANEDEPAGGSGTGATSVESRLREIAGDANGKVEDRGAALGLLAGLPSEEIDAFLRKLLEGDAYYVPELRIAAAAALSRNSRTAARDALTPLLATEDPATAAAAALALAELGSFEPEVRRLLQRLKDEPSEQGRRARLLLENDHLLRQIEQDMARGTASSEPEMHKTIEGLRRDLEKSSREVVELRKRLQDPTDLPPLLESLLSQIKSYYVEPEKLDEKELLVEAAKGMVASLDPFSMFMDVADTKRFAEDMSGEYAGIGAQVGLDGDTGYLLIVRPVYKGPAHRAGLRSNDKVTEVEGISTKGKQVDEITKILKGAAGSKIRFKVLRRGWTEEREFLIARETIHLPPVESDVLPGGIGYARVHRFGDDTMEDFSDALDKFDERQIQGLIIDLRDNPGGYLRDAVNMVDEFVDDDPRPIVRQAGNSEAAPSEEHLPKKGMRRNYPIVVLVNRGSASASEIVAGALQDYGRATIVGQRTFGKGSVQRLYDMPREIADFLGGETKLRLTVQYYYLPSGRSIHAKRDLDRSIVEENGVKQEGGVIPDLDVEQDDVPPHRVSALEELLRVDAFGKYLDLYSEKHAEDFKKIAAVGDGGKTEAYPDFDKFFGPLNTSHATADDIRRQLRGEIRLRIEDQLGEMYPCDYGEDLQLQHAIVALLGRIDRAPAEIPEYAAFAEKIGAAPPAREKKGL